MQILIAEDEEKYQSSLKRVLTLWEYDVISVSDGISAVESINNAQSPLIVLLDWLMPGIEGVEVCRRVRECERDGYAYIIMLTVKDSKEEIVEALEAGADDHLVKPFDNAELHARIRVGERFCNLYSDLSAKIKSLNQAQDHIQMLHGILPICSYCHRIRTEDDSWERLENYITQNSEAVFSHTFCPECMKKYCPDIYKKKHPDAK